MNISISSQIESILFWKGEPMTFTDISKILNISEDEIKNNVKILEEDLKNRGIVLINNDEKLSLGTNPEMSEKISALIKEELSKDLSKATLETLSIILYKGSVTRSEIDYVRGVNSQFILRALTIRGLIYRENDPKDERTFIYKPSIELLSYLGITNRESLPDFEKINQEILNFMNQNKNSEKNDGTN